MGFSSLYLFMGFLLEIWIIMGFSSSFYLWDFLPWIMGSSWNEYRRWADLIYVHVPFSFPSNFSEIPSVCWKFHDRLWEAFVGHFLWGSLEESGSGKEILTRKPPFLQLTNLVDVSDIFFFLLGEGRGSPKAPRGGGGESVFYWKSQEGWGGVSPGRGGAGRVSVVNRGIFLGGAKYFFFGAETSTKLRKWKWKFWKL